MKLQQISSINVSHLVFMTEQYSIPI